MHIKNTFLALCGKKVEITNLTLSIIIKFVKERNGSVLFLSRQNMKQSRLCMLDTLYRDP